LSDRYTIERELGRGGMATVFLAQDLKHHRPVAIKVLRPELANAIGAERFLQEIEIAAQLTHPHILPLFDSAEADGLLYYVMPYVEGESLRDRLDREKQLPLEDTLKITENVAAALTYAHSLGIVHRDIKPGNIMLEGGEAVIADFGIARAITSAGGEQLTETGITLGTPAYMSPEQASGEENIDGRSDQYALGCVVHEMLTGEPPFIGGSAQSIISKHVSQPPPSIRVMRPSVPTAVEEAVLTALAKIPADRFATVTEFAEGLTIELASYPSRGIARRLRRRWWIAAVPVLIAGIVLALLFPPSFLGSNLDPSRYVIATLDPDPSSEANWRWRIELEAALAQVPDIVLAEDYRINDWILRNGEPANEADWLHIAKQLGAGRLLVSRPFRMGDSTLILVDEYDVRRGSTIDGAEARLSVGVLVGLAATLVEDLFDLPAGSISADATGNSAAMRAYVAGQQALASWDLREAQRHFANAVDLDPNYARAHLLLAKVRLWAGDPADEWRTSARQAAGSLDLLRDDRERQLALALRALAQGQFPEACDRFSAMVALDSLNFEAWFGLAECHAQDDVVIPDPTSPTRWRFRSSYHTAIEAYRRVLEEVPSFAFKFRWFEKLSSVLDVETAQLRLGYPEGEGADYYIALPAILNDTLGYVPAPASDPLALGSISYHRAIDRNRERLFLIAEDWVTVFPDSAASNLAFALALELKGSLGEDHSANSALAAARKAYRVSTNGEDSLQAVHAESRILLKLGRFEEARARADYALNRWRDPSETGAQLLAGLAALTGRPRTSATHARVTYAEGSSGPFGISSAPVLRDWQAFSAYAAVGAPQESLIVYSAHLDTLLQVYRTLDQIEELRCQLLWTPRSIAFPVLREITADEACWAVNPLLAMQWALAHGWTDSVLVRFRRLNDQRTQLSLLPGNLDLGHVYQEAWLLLEVGDTVQAVSHISQVLSALGALRTSVLTEPQQAAGLVRIMALRAELAARRQDSSVAKQWASSVATIWSQAGPELDSLVDRMLEISE
jgi:serine/threonine protein kinase